MVVHPRPRMKPNVKGRESWTICDWKCPESSQHLHRRTAALPSTFPRSCKRPLMSSSSVAAFSHQWPRHMSVLTASLKGAKIRTKLLFQEEQRKRSQSPDYVRQSCPATRTMSNPPLLPLHLGQVVGPVQQPANRLRDAHGRPQPQMHMILGKARRRKPEQPPSRLHLMTKMSFSGSCTAPEPWSIGVTTAKTRTISLLLLPRHSRQLQTQLRLISTRWKSQPIQTSKSNLQSQPNRRRFQDASRQTARERFPTGVARSRSSTLTGSSSKSLPCHFRNPSQETFPIVDDVRTSTLSLISCPII